MAEYLIDGAAHADRLPGEPIRGRGPAWRAGPRLIGYAAVIGGLVTLTAAAWIPFLLGSLVAGYPPTAARPRQAVRYLGHIWARRLPAPGLALYDRLWMTLAVARTMALAPAHGLAWMLDAALYGRALAAVPVEAPIFVVSAARSGSTQLAQYIEADPQVVAPSLLQIVFPYLWLWRLVRATAGRWVSPDRVRAIFRWAMPPEFLERHEADPFLTDTFDIAVYTRHLNRLAPMLGPHQLVDEFVIVAGQPANARLWDTVLVDLLDGIARKALLFAGAAPGRRLMVKGHFLAAADALAARYPDGRFVTMIRTPSARVRSMINFLWCNPLAPGASKPPWPWLAAGVTHAERAYNAAERAWFTRDDGPRRVVLRFSDYVRDLEGVMRTLYAGCFDTDELPPGAPRAHVSRRRAGYSVDRSLGQLGIDGAAYDAAQAAYVAWCDTAATAPSDPPASGPPTGPMSAPSVELLRADREQR